MLALTISFPKPTFVEIYLQVELLPLRRSTMFDCVAGATLSLTKRTMFFMEAATIKQQESTEQRHIRIKAINSEDFKKQITCHILGCHSVTRLLIKDEFVFTVFVVCSSEYETGTIAWIGCSG